MNTEISNAPIFITNTTLYFLYLKHDGAELVKINMKHVHFRRKKDEITPHFLDVLREGRE